MIGDVVLGCKKENPKIPALHRNCLYSAHHCYDGRFVLGESNERHRMAPSFPETCRVRLRCEPWLGSLLYLCGQDAVP
mgnify:CR=1 FL=1